MKQLCMGIAMLGAALVATPALGYAQQPVDIGKREYVNSCAVCHGDNGRGNGPLGAFLNKAPTDLTTIQKNNIGVFPFDRVYRVIDGREAVAFYGTRDMPVWGKWYSICAGPDHRSDRLYLHPPGEVASGQPPDPKPNWTTDRPPRGGLSASIDCTKRVSKLLLPSIVR